MIDFRTIINICGFDERFKVWGGEDDDLRLRLERIRFYRINLQCTLYHLYHNTLINHANVENAEQKKKQCEAFEDKTIFRTTLLSQYSNYSII